jgi:hypothetical protein
MGTFRDDIVRAGRKIAEAVGERTDRELVRRDEMQVLEADAMEGRGTRKLWDYMWQRIAAAQQGQGTLGAGRMPHDVSPVLRIASAAQAQRAWVEDPMAGQMVDLYVSFVFGRGVPTARANDPDVQDVLDRAWEDRANQLALTSFPKLVEKGIDLSLQSNVYWRCFDEGEDGVARLALQTFEDVVDVVRHDQNKYRITYYKVLERQVRFDFRNGRYVVPTGPAGETKTTYVQAHGAFDPDDKVMVAQDERAAGPLHPPQDLLREGKLLHLAVNKTSEMAFGVPRMNRLTRWFTAYNEVLESHVNRMKAMASILMTQTVDGNDRDLDRVANQVMGRRARLGEARDVAAAGPEMPGHGLPPGAIQNGMLQQNGGVKHEPFKIDTGASDIQASIPQLRAQASGIFPPTYYGQDSGALAGQQSVELPVLKFIERDQESWLGGIFNPFADANIAAALRVGDLTEWRDPTDEETIALAAEVETGTPSGIETNEQGQVKRDLGYEITLPSPLKRAMGDIVTSAVSTAAAVDPAGEMPEMSRWLFGFILAEAFDVKDPQRIVDQVLPKHRDPDPNVEEPEVDPATGRPLPPEGTETITGPDGQQHPPENPGGAPVKSPNPEDRKPVQEAVVDQDELDAIAARVNDLFDDQVLRVVDDQLAVLRGDGDA